MSGTLWPADAVAGAPSYTGRMLRDTGAVLLAGATTARPFGAISGVRPGTSTTIGTAPTSTTWQVTPFGGVIDTEASNIAGPYQYAFVANQTGTIAAQGGTARWDRLDVQLSDPAEGDGTSTPAINVVYTQGTTTSLPAAPARSHPLYTIVVPATGGGSPTLLFTAPGSVAAGGILPASGSTFYPASPYKGQYVDDATLGLLRWNGTAWAAITSAGLTKLKPTPVATGGTATVSSGGRTTFTSVNAVNLTNLFPTSSPLYDYFEVEFFISLSSGSPFITGVLGNAGVPVTSANYDSNYNFRATTSNGPANQAATAQWVLSAGASNGAKRIRMRIESPNIAFPTMATATGAEYTVAAVPASFTAELAHRLPNAYTDLQFLASTGTITGWVDVFGYSNA